MFCEALGIVAEAEVALFMANNLGHQTKTAILIDLDFRCFNRPKGRMVHSLGLR